MKKVLILTTALTTLFFCSGSYAAGFHLREQSAAAQGNSYAGATAGAEDISYSYYNVAGITRHKGIQFSGGATYIAPKASAKNVKSNAGVRDADVQNVVHAAVSPNFAASYQINNRWFVAISGNSPFGLITKYDRDWVGGDHGITSDLKTATITPMVAYKATDKFSLGAGLQVQYVWAHLTSSSRATQTSIVTTNGNALDLGYQLGAMYEFTDKTRIGVGYRSSVKHKLKGKMKTNGSQLPAPYGTAIDALLNQKISVDLETPAMLSFGAYHDITSRWAVMAEYQRVFWSSFQKLDFNSRSGGYTISRVQERWRDTNFYSLGTSYMLDEQWKLRVGLAYDQSAVRFKNRTPRVPDSDRIWYSAGLGYQYSEKLEFNAGFTYIKAHNARLNTAMTGNKDNGQNVSADYRNSVQAFAFGFVYKF